MSEEYCDWTTRPDGVNLCTIACPGDCVLSSWSDWSICPKVNNIFKQFNSTEICRLKLNKVIKYKIIKYCKLKHYFCLHFFQKFKVPNKKLMVINNLKKVIHQLKKLYTFIYDLI